jgi:hypothetical protein
MVYGKGRLLLLILIRTGAGVKTGQNINTAGKRREK